MPTVRTEEILPGHLPVSQDGLGKLARRAFDECHRQGAERRRHCRPSLPASSDAALYSTAQRSTIRRGLHYEGRALMRNESAQQSWPAVGCTLRYSARPGRVRDYPDMSTRRAPNMMEGDIVVTRVARHYALGRVNGDRPTQTPVETQNSRSDALGRACALARADHRVFLYEKAASSTCLLFDCTPLPDGPQEAVIPPAEPKTRRRPAP